MHKVQDQATARADAGLGFARRTAILCFCALFMLMEGLDLAAMPLAVPHVSGQWRVPPADFAFSLSAVVLGIGVAAVTLAPLGERFGRRRMIIWSGLFSAAVTIGTASASSVPAFTLWRLLTGLGLGACLPNVTASVAHIAPLHLRARILAAVNTAIPVGSVLAGFLAAPLVRVGNWQSLFLSTGILTLLVTIGIGLLLPRPVAGGAGSMARPASRTALSSSPVLDLFRTNHRLCTFLLLGLATTNTFLMYMMVNWLPTLLPRGGISVDAAARLGSVFQFGGIIGGFGFAYMMDRGRAIPAFVTGYLLAAAGLAGLALLPQGGVLWVALLLATGLGISGAHVAITIFGMGFYPQYLLSSFIGVSIAVTRAGAIGGPLAGGWLIGHSSGVGTFMLAAAGPTLLCLGWVGFIARMKGRAIRSAV